MKQTEAEDLAQRIFMGWPQTSRIALPEWEDAIKDLDAGAVLAAFTRLRDESKYPPSIAELKQTVAAIGGGDGGRRRVACDLCNSDGMATVGQIIHGLPYEVVVRCRCTNGEAAGEGLRRVNEANEAEHRRVFGGERSTDNYSHTFPREDLPRKVAGV